MFAGTAPPPSTWVQVAGLARPEYLVEIEAVAAVPAPAQ
jgi:enamine deaminase RidA (YjgF/YER057c/UK114 family)